MALYNFLAKTAEYIDATTETRAGHHNACIGQKLLNSNIAYDDMTENEKIKFDDDCLEYLKRLDIS